MATQGVKAKDSLRVTFEKFSKANHLDRQMGRMHRLDQKGLDKDARLANFGVLLLDLGGIFFNGIKAPLVAAVQPAAAFVHAGAGITDGIVRLTKLDTLEAASRRKLIQVLPTITKYVPSIADLGRTILNVAKYAIGFFSSLIIGFISVEANIWVHHKLGLICNPELAKKDRKNSILNYARQLEGRSLKTDCKNRYKAKVEKKVRKIIERQVSGYNQYITYQEVFKRKPIQRRDIVLDDNNKIKAALDEATHKKREAAKAELEKASGHKLTEDDIELIKAKYWKKLSDPFAFEINDDLAPHYQEFLSKYFNWKKEPKGDVTTEPRCLPFKSQDCFREYLNDYNKWNLTEDEIKVVLARIDKSINKKDYIAVTFAEAENSLVASKKKNNRKIVEIEKECAELDERVTAALAAKQEQLNRKLTIQETVNVNTKEKQLLKTEHQIIAASKGIGRNLSWEESEKELIRISNELMCEFSDDEKTKLQTFALTALETAQLKAKDILKAAKKRPALMPLEHHYELKNMAMRQLQREFPQSIFNRPFADTKSIQFFSNENKSKNIDAEVMLKVEERMPAFSDDTTEEELKHYDEVERPRLYEQLLLEKMFPAFEDVRKFRSSDQNKRTVRFEALEKRRRDKFQEFLNNHKIDYVKDEKGDYLRDDDGKAIPIEFIAHKGKRIPKEIIIAEATRKDNEENEPIMSTSKNISWMREKTKLDNKAWSDVRLEFVAKIDGFDSHKDNCDYGKSKITFLQSNVQNESSDNKKSFKNEFTFKELDEIVKERKKVFEKAAKKYKAIKDRIFITHYGVNGVNDQVEKYQKANIKEQYEDSGFYYALSRFKEENDGLKEQMANLQNQNQELSHKVHHLEIKLKQANEKIQIVSAPTQPTASTVETQVVNGEPVEQQAQQPAANQPASGNPTAIANPTEPQQAQQPVGTLPVENPTPNTNPPEPQTQQQAQNQPEPQQVQQPVNQPAANPTNATQQQVQQPTANQPDGANQPANKNPAEQQAHQQPGAN